MQYNRPDKCNCNTCLFGNLFPFYETELHPYKFNLPCEQKFKKFNMIMDQGIKFYLMNNILQSFDLLTFQIIPLKFYNIFEEYLNITNSSCWNECTIDPFDKKMNVECYSCNSIHARNEFSFVIYADDRQNHPLTLIHNKDWQIHLNCDIPEREKLFNELFKIVGKIFDDYYAVKMVNVMVNSIHFCFACFFLVGVKPHCKFKQNVWLWISSLILIFKMINTLNFLSIVLRCLSFSLDASILSPRCISLMAKIR